MSPIGLENKFHDNKRVAGQCIKLFTIFIVLLKNGRNWASKLIFCLTLRGLLFTLSYDLRVTLQVSFIIKASWSSIIVVSLISIAFVDAKLQVFKGFHTDSASMKWPFLGEKGEGCRTLSPPKRVWFWLKFQQRY